MRFYIGWILSSILMYLAFYSFHGLLTNDFLKLEHTKTFFFITAAVVYLIVSLGMCLVYNSDTAKKIISAPYKRGLAIGTLSALLMYGIAITVGISFSVSRSAINVLVDIIWQLIEQNIGAFIIVVAHTLFYHAEEEHTNFL